MSFFLSKNSKTRLSRLQITVSLEINVFIHLISISRLSVMFVISGVVSAPVTPTPGFILNLRLHPSMQMKGVSHSVVSDSLQPCGL